MAGAYLNVGQLDRAEQLYRKAKYHFEQAGDNHVRTATLDTIKVVSSTGHIKAFLCVCAILGCRCT
jgi:hypothetical protein